MIPAQLARFGRGLIYGFVRKLRPYETAIFERIFSAATTDEREVLKRQLDSRERIQRWSDRMLYIGLPPGHKLPTLHTPDEIHCYARLKLWSSAGKITAKVMLYRGCLHTVEFSKSVKPLQSGPFRILDISLHPEDSGYAEKIDAIEHGSQYDA